MNNVTATITDFIFQAGDKSNVTNAVTVFILQELEL